MCLSLRSCLWPRALCMPYSRDPHLCLGDPHLCLRDPHLCCRDPHLCHGDPHLGFGDVCALIGTQAANQPAVTLSRRDWGSVGNQADGLLCYMN